MGKLTKVEGYRRDGMLYALKIAKEKGIEGLENEIKFRNITKAPLALPREELDEFVNRVKINTLDTITILAAMTLHDEFDFGEKRVQRFIDRMDSKADCLIDGDCTWMDNIKALEDECNIHLQIRSNDTDVKVGKRQ